MNKFKDLMLKFFCLKFFLKAFAVILIIIMLLGLIKLGNIFAFFFMFNWISNSIITDSGINIWISKIISVFLSLLIIVSISSLVSFKKEKRIIGLLLFSVCFILYQLVIFVSTKNNNFLPDGSNNKCVARNLEGNYEYVSCGNKIHPIYGTIIEPITPDIVRIIDTYKNGVPVYKRVLPEKNMQFFTFDGKPRLWYYQHENGQLEFFDHSGNHPQFNIALKPINPSIVKLIFNYIDSKNGNMIIFNSPINNNDKIVTSYPDLKNESALKDLRDYLTSLNRKY